MKTVKKIVALGLAISMFGGLAACKKDDDTKVSETTVKTTENADKGNEETTTSSEPMPWEGDPVELKIHWHSNNKYTLNDDDGNLKPVFALAAEKTNTKIVSTANPVATDSKQEFELAATKQFPDDIYGGNSLRPNIISYGEQGAFIPLNDLIDQYAPNIKAYLEENPDVKTAMTADDGNIYMINYQPKGDVGRAYFIRQDWLDKLNLQVPTTFDELEKVLYAFKNDDPNGNGIADEVPIFNDKKTEIIRLVNLWGARCYGFDSTTERVVRDENDHFYHAWMTDEFKEGLKGMAKWYADGIIDQEVYTRKDNTARPTLWTQTNVGGCTHEWLASTTAYNDNEELLAVAPDFKVVGFLPVTNADGSQGFEEQQRALIKPDGWAISANCKNPEVAIHFLDWFFTEEGSIATNYGIEGQSYTMVDGKPTFTDEVLSQTGVNTYLQKTYGAQYPIGYCMDYEYERQWTQAEGQKTYDLYSENLDKISVPQTPVMSFTADEQAIYDKYVSNLNSYLDEETQLFVTGQKDIDAEWDNYIAKCKEYGADEIVALYQKVYDERMK